MTEMSEHSGLKRKRVTRACDECRKKKAKCDGQQPCVRCAVYSYDCTYDKPSIRRKAGETNQLETKLKLAEDIIEKLLPGIDVHSADFDLKIVLEELASGKRPSGKPNPSITLTPIVSKDFSVLTSPDSNESLSDFRVLLPPKKVSVELFEAAWSNACVLFRFYHRPQFIRDADLLYNVHPDEYTDREYRILPLLYSVLAVGCLFSKERAKGTDEGFRYFSAARKLLDITDVSGFYAIESIVMMIIFLQCSARLTTCYSYIGIAMRAALRSGLHRKISKNFNPIQLETRRRLFWTIRKMDIYVNAMLGLPCSIEEDQFDQELPTDMDDENITEDGYFAQENSKLSSVAISNAHTKLMEILHRIMKDVYPIKPKDGANHIFNIANGKIGEIEHSIVDWHDKLPVEMKPGTDVPWEYIKANRLLSLAYCYVQLVLYRPFIHYCHVKCSDKKRKIYARKCVDVSRRVMYLANDMVTKGILHGAYWYSIYTIFFSVSCLVYYVHENVSALNTPMIRLEAEMGIEALNQLKESSAAAKRSYDILNNIFEQLNQSTLNSSNNGDQSLTANNIRPPANYPNILLSQRVGIIKNTDNAAYLGTLDDSISPDTISPTASYSRVEDTSLNANFRTNFTPSITSNDHPSTNDNPSTKIEEKKYQQDEDFYIPGIMDDFDTQVFGKFLPPYMMNELDVENGLGDGNGATSASTAINASMSSTAINGSTASNSQTAITGTNGTAAAVNIPANEPLTTTTGTNETNALYERRDSLGINKLNWDDYFKNQIELSGVNI